MNLIYSNTDTQPAINYSTIRKRQQLSQADDASSRSYNFRFVYTSSESRFMIDATELPVVAT
jgi:hypothetical protein